MKKILFVDDEAKVLDGLRRMLQGMRKEWEPTFAKGGPAALDALTAERFDAVVSDRHMPGVDGLELLAEVQRKQPQTLRVLLSEDREREPALGEAGAAQLHLGKGCEPEQLCNAVDRALDLRRLLDSETLRGAIGCIESLPPAPSVYRELSRVLAREEVDLDRVSDIVSQDASLTARILRLVNSSLFGLACTITDLRQAASLLGTSMIEGLVLSMEAFRDLARSGLPLGFTLERERAHALLCASVARRLLDDRARADEVFLAAVLHDVGKVVMAVKMAPLREQVLHHKTRTCLPLHESEYQVLNTSHAEIGAYLLGLWGLPDSVVEAIAHHHAPGRLPHDTFEVVDAVHVADSLVHELESGCAPVGSDRPGLLDLEHLEALGVAGRLEEWRALARELQARSEQEAV